MSSIGDDIASSTILTIILGAPIMIGIGILAVPLIIVAGVIGIPVSTLIKSLLVFGAAVFFVWLFSRHQIIENGIVGLIVGTLVHSHFKIHPVWCILIGLGIIGLLFLISGFNVGFWIKTIIFSLIVSFFIWGFFYSSSGALPAQDKIWSISFFIVFLLENIFIRLSVRYDILEMSSAPDKEKQKRETEPTVSGGHTVPFSTQAASAPQKINKYSMVKSKDFAGAFKLKEKFWDSEAEQLVYDALKIFIDEHYVIVPHAAPREIFKWNWKENWRLTNKVNEMHFDFVIHHKDQHVNRPALVIEVWGSEHHSDPKTKERDEFKQAVLKNVGVKYIIIDLSQSMSNQSIMEKTIECIKNEIPSREHYTVYCPVCSSVMEIKTNSNTLKEFYGCTKFNLNDKERSCKGTRNVIDVPPLYTGIPAKVIRTDKIQKEQEGKVSNEK